MRIDLSTVSVKQYQFEQNPSRNWIDYLDKDIAPFELFDEQLPDIFTRLKRDDEPAVLRFLESCANNQIERRKKRDESGDSTPYPFEKCASHNALVQLGEYYFNKLSYAISAWDSQYSTFVEKVRDYYVEAFRDTKLQDDLFLQNFLRKMADPSFERWTGALLWTEATYCMMVTNLIMHYPNQWDHFWPIKTYLLARSHCRYIIEEMITFYKLNANPVNDYSEKAIELSGRLSGRRFAVPVSGLRRLVSTP